MRIASRSGDQKFCCRKRLNCEPCAASRRQSTLADAISGYAPEQSLLTVAVEDLFTRIPFSQPERQEVYLPYGWIRRALKIIRCRRYDFIRDGLDRQPALSGAKHRKKHGIEICFHKLPPQPFILLFNV